MVDKAIRIRDITAEAGTKVRGYLTIGETPTESIQIPIVIINGEQPGPVLCLTAGVHAAEYPGIDAVSQISQSLEPSDLTGAVIAVPVVNMPMFQRRSGFTSPIDGLNLNRTAPGNSAGSISEVLVNVLLTEVIAQASYHIDCHGGDLGEILWPYASFALTGNTDLDRQGEAMTRLYSPHIIALYREGTSLMATPGAITAQAAQRGIVSMLAEAGSNGTLESADVEIHMRGIENIMRYLSVIPGDPAITDNQLRAVDQFVVSAQRGGLIHLKIEIGETIEMGREIAEICNVFGDVVERVHAPRDGIARIIWAHKAVNTGDPIVKCWVTEPAGSFPDTDRFVAD